jgi:hypothetical protein
MGAWNRTNKTGGDVVRLFDNNSYVGRPVDVLVMKDGSVLISDDWNGGIWRMSYGGNARDNVPMSAPWRLRAGGKMSDTASQERRLALRRTTSERGRMT